MTIAASIATWGEGFEKLFACPDFAGSYLSFDGAHLYLSHRHRRRPRRRRALVALRPEVVAFKAGRLLLSELREQITLGETFALESTLRGRTYPNLFEKAKKQSGYRIELHFVWIPNPEEAIRRVRQRVKEGGHHVPAADIRRRFRRSIEHC